MKDCLVMIDIQNGFLSESTNAVPNKVLELLGKKHFNHMVGTQFINQEGSPYVEFMGWRGLMDETSQQVHPVVSDHCERVFPKTIYSCFSREFELFLKQNDIGKLYFLGIDTDCCVLKSATDCFERNIPFEVLINYCASNGGAESHQAAITVMQRTIGKQAINDTL